MLDDVPLASLIARAILLRPPANGNDDMASATNTDPADYVKPECNPNTGPPFEADRIIREPECKLLTGLGKTKRFELMKEGMFPAKVKLSERASGWSYVAVQTWIRTRPTV